MAFPEPIEALVREFARMPGIGRRTAERLAFHVLRSRPEDALRLALAIRDVKKGVKTCRRCCGMAAVDPCPICADAERDRSTVMVIEQPRDQEAFEAAGFRGLYHVLGGSVNPIEGIAPEHLTIERLVKRVREDGVREVILGVDADFEGDGTALVVARALEPTGVSVTRIARGLPSGSSIEYANASVLADALTGRRAMESEG
ncbi:MAG: recombination mediator RecR [Planctomycetota bacterium JB042]